MTDARTRARRALLESALKRAEAVARDADVLLQTGRLHWPGIAPGDWAVILELAGGAPHEATTGARRGPREAVIGWAESTRQAVHVLVTPGANFVTEPSDDGDRLTHVVLYGRGVGETVADFARRLVVEWRLLGCPGC